MPKKAALFIANLAFWALLVGGVYLTVLHRQDIYDWWALRSYTPTTEATQLADETTMIGTGRNDFYISQPEVENSEEFNSHCADYGEQSIVLGCYVNQRIYLYNVTDERLSGVVEVTAAHEMLHAVYARYDQSEKDKVDAMIEAELPNVTDERLKELINLYNQSEPGELLNEMHSILGTEYANLSPKLEEYYAQFFSNRQVVVNLAANYQAAFTESETKIEEIDAEMASIKTQVDNNSTQLENLKAEIDSQAQQLNKLRSTDTSAYNNSVPAYNELINEYNNLVETTRGLIDGYNQLVIEHNNEAAAQNSLYSSLNSQYQTVSN